MNSNSDRPIKSIFLFRECRNVRSPKGVQHVCNLKVKISNCMARENRGAGEGSMPPDLLWIAYFLGLLFVFFALVLSSRRWVV